jgi:uncharacterized HAD superfamily protein
MEKTIVFDIDGCLADFVKGFTELGHKMFGIPVLTTDQQLTWDAIGGTTKEQKNAMWEVLKRDEMFWYLLDPLVNATTFARIDSLSLYNRVYFLTTRVGVKVKQQTERWLAFNGIYHPSVIISGTHDKGEICKYLGADYAIEDKVENALSIDTVSKAKTFLLDRPYNRIPLDDKGPNQVKRVTSVNQFLDEVNRG